jgi:hypothetical protein
LKKSFLVACVKQKETEMENKIDFTVLDQAILEFGSEKKALIAIL